MTKLLRTYITFIIDSPNFSPTSLQKIVICKNNSMRIALNPNFNVPVFYAKAQSGRALGLFTTENIEEDELAPFTRKEEEMKVDALDANVKIEEEEREVHANLRLQHAQNIFKLRVSYKIYYKKGYNYQSFQTPTLKPEDKLALIKAYISKKPVGRIFMVRKNIQRERKYLNTL